MPEENHMLPLDWEPLHEEAERLAQEFHETEWPHRPWCFNHEADRAHKTSLQARLLRDLKRPESRDLWHRWIEKHPDCRQYYQTNRNKPDTLIRSLVSFDPELGKLLEAQEAAGEAKPFDAKKTWRKIEEDYYKTGKAPERCPNCGGEL
jgi:hypothetical protein